MALALTTTFQTHHAHQCTHSIRPYTHARDPTPILHPDSHTKIAHKCTNTLLTLTHNILHTPYITPQNLAKTPNNTLTHLAEHRKLPKSHF